MWKIFPHFRMRCRHCVRPMHSTKYEYVSWIRFEFRLQQRAQYRVWCALFSRLYLHVYCNVLSFALSTSKLIVSKILFIAKFGEMEGALIHKTGNHLSSDGASARAEQTNKQTKKNQHRQREILRAANILRNNSQLEHNDTILDQSK